jgi:hypothetical protein
MNLPSREGAGSEDDVATRLVIASMLARASAVGWTLTISARRGLMGASSKNLNGHASSLNAAEQTSLSSEPQA